MSDKDFVVKNGLVVNTNFSTNGSQIALSTINSTSNGFLATSTTITVGNSTVNSTINATAFTGKAANSDKLGGVDASGYLTVSGTAADSTKLGGALSTAYVNSTGTYTISGVHTHSANIVITNPAGISVNSSYGTAGQFLTTNGTSTYWSSQKLTSNNNGGAGAIQLNDAGNLGSNSSFLYNQTTNTVTIGNTSVSATINSTVYSGTANNALYLGGQLAAYYVNSSSLTTTLIPYVNSAQLSANLANYVNTTATAYDSARLGGVVAANYVANSGNYTIGGALTFINSSIYTGNVTISNSITANGSEGSAGQVLTSGGANKNVYWSTATNVAAQYAWSNTHSFANVVTFNGNAVFTNAVSLNGSYGIAGQQLLSGGPGSPSTWGFAPGANTAGGGGSIQFWNGTTFGSSIGLSFAATGNNLSVANSININGTTINSTSYAGKSADSDKLGTVAAAFYALKADVHFIGTTSVALNRASGPLNLTGINIDGTAATITGVYSNTLVASQITNALGYTPANSTTASASVTGIISSTDWNTFNNKQNALSTASASVSGILSSADWNIFNNKQATLSAANASANGYLSFTDWVTFNNKSNTASPTFTGSMKIAGNYYMNAISVATSSTPAINVSSGNYFTYTASGSTTFSFTNVPSSGNLVSIAIKIYGGGSAAPTLIWPGGTKWPSATAPTPSSNTDLWVFYTDDGGSSWRGNLVQRDSR